MPMLMTDSGHIIHAQAMFSLTYHLAWGNLPTNYPDPWSISQVPPLANSLVVTEQVTKGIDGGLDQLVNVGILYIVSVQQGSTLYDIGIDYNLTGRSVDWSLIGGEAPIAGSSYTVVYRYNTTALTSLINELGRRSPTIQGYVNLDPNGDIVANGTSWSLTGVNGDGSVPSANIYFMFKFDSTDAIGEIIYQLGLFVGTVLMPGTPVGLKYLTQANILNPGQLYMTENVEPFSRYAGKREIFEYVITY
jgi:Domain of unknown function (DUF4815)